MAKKSLKKSLTLDEQEALLRDQNAAVQQAIADQKREAAQIASQLRLVALRRQEAEEKRLGKLAYAAGLAGVSTDNLATVFMLALDYLNGTMVLQVVGTDGEPLTVPDDAEDQA